MQSLWVHPLENDAAECPVPAKNAEVTSPSFWTSGNRGRSRVFHFRWFWKVLRMLETILIVLLLLMLLGAWPSWPHSRGWGYYPSGTLGLVLVIVLVLALLGRM
jgi:hypothetical protein